MAGASLNYFSANNLNMTQNSASFMGGGLYLTAIPTVDLTNIVADGNSVSISQNPQPGPCCALSACLTCVDFFASPLLALLA